jgi:hypothetical protein
MADGPGGAEPEGDFELPGGVNRDDSPPDPGLGVGYSGEDLDDVSPPVFHDGALPVGYEFDSLVPHLGVDSGGGDGPDVAPLFEFDTALDLHDDPANHLHGDGHDAGHDDPGDDHHGALEFDL